jgi:hypothetical protein
MGSPVAEGVAHQGGAGDFHGAPRVAGLAFRDLLPQGGEHAAQEEGDHE